MMRRFVRLLAGLLGLVLLIAAASAAIWQTWVAAGAFLAAGIFAMPFVGRVHPALRAVLVIGCVGLAATAIRPAADNSIYSTPEVEARAAELYAEALARWPVPQETRRVDTTWGEVHVIISGPEDAPPMLLLHASAMGGWSWSYNVEGLSTAFRLFAVDLVGDIGLSRYHDLGRVMRTGADQADHYDEVMDALGLEGAVVVGASEGGFIASNLAIHRPERVERLILLGPMGYRGAGRAAARITLAQLFPVAPVRAATFRWAFSDNADLATAFDEWFTLAMTGMFPAKVPPLPLSAADRARITAPTLFVFGTRDRVVGDAEAAATMVWDMPDVRVEIVDAGHLMAAENPGAINRLILGFAGAGG